jgi:hypothetical protein
MRPTLVLALAFLVAVAATLHAPHPVDAGSSYKQYAGDCTLKWLPARFANGSDVPDSPLYPVCASLALNGGGGGGDPNCFAGQSTVLVPIEPPRDDGDDSDRTLTLHEIQLREVDMSDLTLGQWVVVGTWSRLAQTYAAVEDEETHAIYVLSRVVDLRHKDARVTGVFVRITTASTAVHGALLISANHVLYRRDDDYERETAVFAKELAVGDALAVNGQTERITVIERDVHALGVFAPETTAGRLWVNRVAVSCYSQCKVELLAWAYHTTKRWM